MVCFIWDSQFLITYHLSTFCDYLSVVLSNVLNNGLTSHHFKHLEASLPSRVIWPIYLWCQLRAKITNSMKHEYIFNTFPIHPFKVYFNIYDIAPDLFLYIKRVCIFVFSGLYIYMEHIDKSFHQWPDKGLFTWLHLCYIIFVHYLFTRFKGETDNHSPNGMSKYLVMNHDTKHTYSICYPVEDFCLSIIKNTNKLEIFYMQRWMTENQKPSYRFQRVCLYFKNTKMC